LRGGGMEIKNHRQTPKADDKAFSLLNTPQRNASAASNPLFLPLLFCLTLNPSPF
jgi:hypothetical protein